MAEANSYNKKTWQQNGILFHKHSLIAGSCRLITGWVCFWEISQAIILGWICLLIKNINDIFTYTSDTRHCSISNQERFFKNSHKWLNKITYFVLNPETTVENPYISPHEGNYGGTSLDICIICQLFLRHYGIHVTY